MGKNYLSPGNSILMSVQDADINIKVSEAIVVSDNKDINYFVFWCTIRFVILWLCCCPESCCLFKKKMVLLKSENPETKLCVTGCVFKA